MRNRWGKSRPIYDDNDLNALTRLFLRRIRIQERRMRYTWVGEDIRLESLDHAADCLLPDVGPLPESYWQNTNASVVF